MKRDTTTSRLLAAVLAVAMVASLWPQGAVRAADASPDPTAAEQATAAEPVPADEATPTADVTTTDDAQSPDDAQPADATDATAPAPDVSAAEKSAPPSEPAPADGTPAAAASPDPAAQPAALVDPSSATEPATPAAPAIDETLIAANGVVVEVHAPEGAFPEGTTLVVREADTPTAMAAADAAGITDGRAVDARAVDVSFVRDGRELEPAGGIPVRVSLRPISAVRGESFSAIHLRDDGTAEPVASATASRADFDATDFSVYAIVGEADNVNVFERVCVSFRAAGSVVSTQSVRLGDTLEAPIPPTASDADKIFDHWQVGSLDLTGYLGRALSVDDIHAIAAAGSAAFDGYNVAQVTAEASFSDARTVRFHQYPHADVEHQGVVASSMLAQSNGDGGYSVDLSTVTYSPISASASVQITKWELWSDGATEPSQSYGVDEKITVSGETDFYPHLAEGFWVYFDTGDAPRVGSEFFVDTGEGATVPVADLPEATYAGYALEGWFRTRTGDAETGYTYSDQVTEDLTLTSDITLYAKWVQSTSPFKVVRWVEGAEGGPGEGIYTFLDSTTIQGTTGATATVTRSGSNFNVAYGGTSSNYAVGRYDPVPEKSDASAVIENDGSTILNLYYSRRWWVIHFRSSSGGADLHVGKFKWGQYIADEMNASAYGNWYRGCNTHLRFLNGKSDLMYGLSGHISKYVEMPYSNDGTGTHYRNFPAGWETANLLEFYREASPGGAYDKQVTDSAGRSYNVKLYSSTTMAKDISLQFDNYTGYHAYRMNHKGGVRYIGDGDNGSQRMAAGTIYDVNGNKKNGVQVFYKLKTYSISFDTRGGEAIGARSIKFTYPIIDVMPDTTGMTKVGSYGETQTFGGWFESVADAEHAADHPEKSFDPAGKTMHAGNMVLYAGWIDPTFTVSFNSDGGTEVASQTGLKAGSFVAEPETPTKRVGGVDYTFVGWYEDAELTQPWNFTADTVTNKDLTLYAKWVKGREYSVTYHDGDASSTAPGTYRYGARVAVPPAPASAPADFLGWSMVRDDASRLVGQSFVIEHDTDLFAVFGDAPEGSGPAVTLHPNYPEGSAGEASPVTLRAERANAAVTLPSSVAGADAPGWHVVGWAAGAPAAEPDHASGESVAVASDTDLYAVWGRNQLSAELSASFAYDGAPHRPEPTVSGWDGSALERGRDYELSWSEDATSAGEKGVTVSGRGAYALSDPVTLAYEVVPRAVTLAAGGGSSRVGEPVAQVPWSVSSGSLVAAGDLGEVRATTAADGTAVGTWPTTVSFTPSPNYAVTTVDGTYRVSAATLSVTARGYSGTYDGASHAASATLSPAGTGARVWWSAEGPLTGSDFSSKGSLEPPSRSHAGSTTAWYWVEGTETHRPDPESQSGSVELSVAPAPLSARANDCSATYGDEAPADPGVTWIGFVAGEGPSSLSGSLSYSFASAAGESYRAGSPAAAYRVTPSGASSPDYAITFLPGTLTVGRRIAELSWPGPDALPYTGSPRACAAPSVANALAGDDVSVDVAGTASATHAGSYVAVASGLSGAAARNYRLPSTGLSHAWSVERAANSCTVAIDGWRYGEAPADPVCVAGFGASTASFEYAESADGPWSPTPPAHAGTHYVRAVVPGCADWDGATSAARAFRIARAPLTVRARDCSTTYGENAVPAGVDLIGLVAGDTPASVGTTTVTIAFNESADGTGAAYEAGFTAARIYYAVPSGLVAADYDVTYEAGTLTVNKRPARVAARDAQSKKGDGLAAVGWDAYGLAAGDGPEKVASFVRTWTDAVASTAGHYATYAGWAEGVTSHPDYELTFSEGTYTVTRGDVRVAASGWSGTYDGTDDGKAASVALSKSTGEAYPAGKARVLFSATIDFSSGEFLPVEDLATLATAEDVESDGFRAAWARLESAIDDHLAAGDVFETSPTFARAGDHPVHFLVVSEQDAPDVVCGAVSVAVARAALAARARDCSTTYGEGAPADPGYVLEGLCAPDVDASSPTGAREGVVWGEASYSFASPSGDPYAPGDLVGSYRITPAGLAAADYDVSFVPGTLSVGPREVALAWSADDSLEYSGEELAYAGASVDSASVLFGDDVSVGLQAGNRAVGAGSYLAVVTSLAGADAASYRLPADATHAWEVRRASNECAVSATGWTYGQDPRPADASARFGSPVVEYAPAGTSDFTADPPTHAGSYVVRARVAETADWEGAESTTSLEVSRAQLVVRALDRVADELGEVPATDSPAEGVDYLLDGLMPGDSVEVSLSYGRGGEAAEPTTDAPGTWDVFCAADAGPDYEVTCEAAALTVRPTRYDLRLMDADREVAAMRVDPSDPALLPAASDLGLSREGWAFAGWAASADSLETSVPDGGLPPVAGPGTAVELHALWSRPVAFHGAAEASAPQAADLSAQSEGALAPQAEGVLTQYANGGVLGPVDAPMVAAREGWAAFGWSSSPDPASALVATPGESFVPEVAEFWAIQSRDVTLSFDGGEGAEGTPSPATAEQLLSAAGAVTSVSLATPEGAPTREGFSLAGWDVDRSVGHVAPGGAAEVAPAASESASYVARAVWEELPAGAEPARRAPLAGTGDVTPWASALVALIGGVAFVAAALRRRRRVR
ncbi:InlB B-repeat-containing protein [Olsenella intestinalis]|uniref:InlB B-repeat-containing protein n=1 Tax=Olsenella intestinalis TaxID=2930083 RepID=UPI00200CDE3A|nr:InlB B-repeat-containing protein [Olsenella intestinalis]